MRVHVHRDQHQLRKMSELHQVSLVDQFVQSTVLYRAYLNVSNDDRIANSVEKVFTLWVAMENQGHPPLCAGQGGKHTLWQAE